jgi:hypothetical protein
LAACVSLIREGAATLVHASCHLEIQGASPSSASQHDENGLERGMPPWVQNGYVSPGAGGHARPPRELENRPFSARTCPRVAASGRASLTRLSLVMKGSPVRVRASASWDLQGCCVLGPRLNEGLRGLPEVYLVKSSTRNIPFCRSFSS